MALSSWDKKNLTGSQQRAVLSYTDAWEKAMRAGDTAAAQKAHESAEAIRRQAGYSGGTSGASFTAASGSKGYDNGGVSKSDVKALQAALGGEQDGYVGPKTQAAAFQRWGASDAGSALKAFQSTSTPERTSYSYDEDEGTYRWNGQTYASKKTLTDAMNRAQLSAAEKNILDRKAQGSGVKLQGGSFGSTTPEESAPIARDEEPRYLAGQYASTSGTTHGGSGRALPAEQAERHGSQTANRSVLGGRNSAAVQQREERRNDRIERYNAAKDAYDSVSHDLTQMYGLTDEEREAKWQRNEQIRQEYEDARHALEVYGVDPDNPNGEPSDGERVWRTVAGGAKSSAAAYTNNVGNAIYGEAARQQQQTAGEIKAWQDTIDAYREVLNDPTASRSERETAQSVIADLERRIGAYQSAYGTGGANERAAGSVWTAADKVADSGAADIERAKEGAGTLGTIAVDAGVSGVQMLGDSLVSPIPGASLLPMAARVLGSSSQEARRNGASFEQAMAYGGLSALTEVATEKMFDGLAGLYGKGAADDIVDSVIERLTKNEAKR